MPPTRADDRAPLGLGLAVSNQFAAGSSLSQELGATLAEVRLARESGYDALLAGEHRLSDPYPYLAPVPFLARAAADAEGMDLVATCLLALHNPVAVAEDLATLDALSGGRAVLCAALGYRSVEYEAFGVDRSSRVARFEEALDVVGRMWRDDEIAVDGRFFQIPPTPISTRPTRPGGPPVWVAATGDRAVARALARGATWAMAPAADLATLDRQLSSHRQVDDTGRHASPPPVLIREVIVTPDAAEARELGERFLRPKYETYRAWGHDPAIRAGEPAGERFEDLAADRFVVGDVDEAVSAIVRMVTTLDVGRLFVHAHWPGLDRRHVRQTIELVGREVIPRVRHALEVR